MTSSTVQFLRDGGVDILKLILPSLMVGLVLRRLGRKSDEKKTKADAIRDLMTYRGDYSSPEFRRSLNKVSIIFHSDESVRHDVRQLYEVMNDSRMPAEKLKRTVVGLIYKLCQQNEFNGLTEYDIDQAFAEAKQTPSETLDLAQSSLAPIIQEATQATKIIQAEVEKEKIAS